MLTDALMRRSRFAPPQPGVGQLTLTDRDHLLFAAIDRHGPLPTTYLYKFTKGDCRDLLTLRRRLTKLYNGACPTHDTSGHRCAAVSYLARDPRQWENLHARYQSAVYGLTKAARALLPPTADIRRSNSFVHDLFLACFTASFELAATRYRSRADIIAHARCPVATREEATPFYFPGPIYPDDLFGDEYAEGKARFFALEVDRANEAVRSRVANSIDNKVAAYVRVLRDGGYRRLGLPNLTVLFATTSWLQRRRIVECFRAHVPHAFRSRFLVKTYPEFGRPWRVPTQLLDVVPGWEGLDGLQDIGGKIPDYAQRAHHD